MTNELKDWIGIILGAALVWAVLKFGCIAGF